MHERASSEETGSERELPEEVRIPEPRIYVASLADYNEGRLHGAWIDAAQTAEEIMEAVRAMLCASPCPSAEEWAIHDYEGFGPLQLHESEDFATVAQLAAGIARYGEAFAAYAEHVGSSSELLDNFKDAYIGRYESGAELAAELLEGSDIEALVDKLPEALRPYVTIDFQGYFADLETAGDITSSEASDGGIHVFWNF
jgi:antirestriction protein